MNNHLLELFKENWLLFVFIAAAELLGFLFVVFAVLYAVKLVFNL